MMARRAAGMAPARITASLTMATPRKMKVPRPPAPMAAAIVATPMVMTVAVRMPARITERARGRRTRQRIWVLVMPMASAACEDRGVDAGEADVGVAEDGEESVEDERDDGGAACRCRR